MKIVVTPSDLFEQGNWRELCDLRGWNPWIVNEGLMDSDEEIVLTLEEASKIGLRFFDTSAREEE